MGTGIHGDGGEKKKKKRKPSPDDTWTPPPPILDTNPALVSGALGDITVGGYTLSFLFSGNYTLEAVKSGTILLGSGTTGYIPKLLDANTITDSNLKVTGSNDLTLAATTVSTATIPFTGTVRTEKKAALTPSASIALNCSLGSLFTLVPDQTCTITPSNGYEGQVIDLEITTSGTSSYTLTFGAPFKSTGTLATGTSTGKIFMLTFVFDGTNYVERSRTTAM